MGQGPDERNKWMSGFPSFLDQNQTYVTGVATNRGSFIGARNPFSAYATNNIEQTRNADVWGYYAANGLTWTSYDIIEPVFISPLNWSEHDVIGIPTLRQFELLFQYTNLLYRMWSWDGQNVAGALPTPN